MRTTLSCDRAFPAFFVGIGLGGFLDGIVLHQILQWHHLLTSEGAYPETTVAGLCRRRFRLLARENADYGFRRNSLGIRLVALWIAAVATGVSLVLAIVREYEWSRWAISAAVGVAALLYWSKVVTPSWVREAAEVYSDRLLESVDTLRRDSVWLSLPT